MNVLRIIIIGALLVGMFAGIVITLSIRIKRIDWMPDPPEWLEGYEDEKI